MVETTILISALAGLASFASPCILPILPAFISYLSGTTINEIQSSTAATTTTRITEIRSTNGQSRNIRSQGKNQRQEPLQHQQLSPSSFSIKKSTRLNIFLNTI